MKKNLLKYTLLIAALSALSITACAGKTAKESSIVSPTEAVKENSSANPSDEKNERNNADYIEKETESSAPKPKE